MEVPPLRIFVAGCCGWLQSRFRTGRLGEFRDAFYRDAATVIRLGQGIVFGFGSDGIVVRGQPGIHEGLVEEYVGGLMPLAVLALKNVVIREELRSVRLRLDQGDEPFQFLLLQLEVLALVSLLEDSFNLLCFTDFPDTDFYEEFPGILLLGLALP